MEGGGLARTRTRILDERADSAPECGAGGFARRFAKQARTGRPAEGRQDTEEDWQGGKEGGQGSQKSKGRQGRHESVQKSKGRAETQESQARQGHQEAAGRKRRGQSNSTATTVTWKIR